MTRSRFNRGDDPRDAIPPHQTAKIPAQLRLQPAVDELQSTGLEAKPPRPDHRFPKVGQSRIGHDLNPERRRRFCHGIGFDKRYVILGNVGIGIAC